MNSATFGFIPPVPVIAPALPLAVPVTTGAAVAGVGLAASLPIVAAVGIGLAGGFLLGAALAQLWGRVAGPARFFSTPWATVNGEWQDVADGAIISGTFGADQVGSGVRCSGTPWSVNASPRGSVNTVAIRSWRYVLQINQQLYGSCVAGQESAVHIAASMRIEYVRNSTGATGYSSWLSWGYGSGANATGTMSLTPVFSDLLINGSAVVPPSSGSDWLGANDATFAADPAESAQEPLIPLPPLLPASTLAGDDVTPTTSSTTAVAVGSEAPAPPPLVPLVPALPGVQQINNSGALVPAALPKLAPTAEEAHFPVPGGAAVGSIATAPQATLAGIAAEVGRIESKLNRLLNPTVSGDASDLLQLLWQGLQGLINSLVDNRPGGQYELSSPCVLDSNDERVVYTAEFPETEDNTAAVLARLDALAALLQIHKDLKQPICHQTPAVGQPVQVQFVQIE